MKGIEILKVGRFLLEMMSKIDLKAKDYSYISLYDEYICMRGNGEKVEYILLFLSQKYNISESTIKRVVKRLSQEVNS